MSRIIRPFEESDYPAILDLGNRVYPEYPNTLEELRFNDKSRNPKEKFARYVIEDNGVVIASGQHYQHIHYYHPRIFDISFDVDPDLETPQIREEIFQHLIKSIERFDPIKLRSFEREDHLNKTKFWMNQGFEEVMRNWESRLDVPSFDFGLYEGRIEKVEKSGIKLVPLSEIPPTEARDRALHVMDNELGADVPSPDPFTPLDFEHFVERTLGRPELFPEAFWLALDGDEFVGISGLWKSLANDELYTGLTGVRKAYRRRGIALALKLKTLEVARDIGCPTVKTWNESNNRAMLSINEAMGFVKQPAWISFAKELGE
jgi:GNAT superfamily N-acetyltransferase